ncbi:MAG TPA: LuxR C-terminal-related transcriptional regulator [Methylomirabilota bacterium]|nr:LuxR C-terminal-related transcriptional regulator [Methylomirabilota bacterium]
MRLDLSRTFGALADLLASTPDADGAFGETLARMLSTLVTFDHVVVFGYRGDERPIDLFDTFDADEHIVFVEKYQQGPYLLDPFYRAATEPKPGFWRMRDLAPDRFFSSEYFRSYYIETGLAEEVGFFVDVSGDVAVVVSLMRKMATGIFPTREIAILQAVQPLVSLLIRSHWSDLPTRFDRQASVRSGGRRTSPGPDTGSVWRDMNLTRREAAVVELVLQGHSSDSIARRLEISNGTVKVHRRNVYRKLNITSQTQLLSIYLDQFVRTGRTT